MARLKEKIAYALGDAAAGGIVWKVMSIAFPLFFTNVFGLSFADAAVLMLVARMFDVVTDPLMGTLADRTQSRFGTYRPWLIYGAIPFGLIFALLLYTPDFGPVGKRIYAYALYLLMMAVYTMVNVPYGSLLGVMTDDDDEKNQFSSFRMVGAYAMGFVTLLSFPYLQKMVGGTAAHQYAVIGAVLGIIAAVMTLACGLLTKERLKPKRAEKFSFQQFLMDPTKTAVAHHQNMVARLSGFHHHICQRIHIATPVCRLNAGFCHFCHLPRNMRWLQQEDFIGTT